MLNLKHEICDEIYDKICDKICDNYNCSIERKNSIFDQDNECPIIEDDSSEENTVNTLNMESIENIENKNIRFTTRRNSFPHENILLTNNQILSSPIKPSKHTLNFVNNDSNKQFFHSHQVSTSLKKHWLTKNKLHINHKLFNYNSKRHSHNNHYISHFEKYSRNKHINSNSNFVSCSASQKNLKPSSSIIFKVQNSFSLDNNNPTRRIRRSSLPSSFNDENPSNEVKHLIKSSRAYRKKIFSKAAIYKNPSINKTYSSSIHSKNFKPRFYLEGFKSVHLNLNKNKNTSFFSSDTFSENNESKSTFNDNNNNLSNIFKIPLHAEESFSNPLKPQSNDSITQVDMLSKLSSLQL